MMKGSSVGNAVRVLWMAVRNEAGGAINPDEHRVFHFVIEAGCPSDEHSPKEILTG